MGIYTEKLTLDRARSRELKDLTGDSFRCSYFKYDKKEEINKRCEKAAEVKIELHSWGQGNSALAYELKYDEWSDQYSYFCNRCAVIRLQYLHNNPKHSLISTESTAYFYRKNLKHFDRLFSIEFNQF